MKILHITDYHFQTLKAGNANKQNKVVKLIVDKLKHIKDIDLIFFTGDLVHNGEKAKDFKSAKELLLDNIAAALSIDYDKIFICPGNHDINRLKGKKSILKFVDEEVRSIDDLEAFIKGTNDDYTDSLAPTVNYFNFVTELYDPQKKKFEDVVTPLFTAHKRVLNNRKVGIASINTAWRALGHKDRGNLLFPVSQLESALNHISQCEVKILLYHHPLSYLREFNERRLEDIIHAEFDIALSGHIHKNSNSIVLTANDGIVKLGASATLAHGEIAEMGYSIINFDYENLKFHVSNGVYDKRDEIITESKPKSFSIPSTEEKIKQNSFRQTLRKRLEVELKAANDLFIGKDKNDNERAFLDIFTPPVLKPKSVSELIEDPDSGDTEVDYEKIVFDAKDYVLLGPDKCGKSSLLRKIQLDLLKAFSLKEMVPFYVDADDYGSDGSNFDLPEVFKRYYELSAKDAQQLLDSGKVILLVDNYNNKYHTFKDKIAEIVEKGKNIRVILCADDTFLKAHDSFSIKERAFTKLHFHKLKKKHIRLLAEKWPDLANEQQDEIVQKIESIFTRLAIPFNFWTVSLFLWIFKKSSDKSFQNDFGLIDLYIESLIEREKLTRNKASFGYEKYKKYLAFFAGWLYIKHAKKGYSATHIEILEFTQSYLSKNPRNDIEPREIFEYLEGKGIIKRLDKETSAEEPRYTFRLNGVFEYFLAFFMTIDPAFKRAILDDSEKYLAFANEFEMYAGFTKNDVEFLKEIYVKTKDIFSVIDQTYNAGTSIDSHLKSKIAEASEFQRTLNNISSNIKALTHLEHDELEEEIRKEFRAHQIDITDIKLKKNEGIDKNSIDTLEKALQILGRVYKNTDDIDDEHLVYEIFDYVINNACFWGFKVIDAAREYDLRKIANIENKKEEKQLLEILTKFIPTVVQVQLSDIIGQRNLSRIIKKRIEEGRVEEKKNQYKLFVLYFLLIDIDFLSNYTLIDDVLEIIKMPVLKYSIIIKINYYLAFKTNGNKDLEKYLRKKAQEAQINFDEEKDRGAIHKGIEDISKKSIGPK